MKTNTKRVLSFIFSVCLLLPCVFAFVAVGAEENAKINVSFSSPAIKCDVGDSVKLADYAVQMTAGEAYSTDVTWSSSAIEIKDGCVSPTEAGVYALTAKSGSKTKNVYLVAKNFEDAEYVLYSADFSNAEKTKSELTVLSQSASTSWDVSGGKLILDASSATGLEIQLAFPAFLGEFGDYNISSDMTITKAANEKRWSSMMFRIQNDATYYYQMCMRHNASLSNGMELAQRLSTKWNVTNTAAYKEKLSASKSYHLEAKVFGSECGLFVNGEFFIYSNSVEYTSGRVGVQVNACRAEYSSFKVTLTDGDVSANRETPYAEANTPESNIALAPSVVTYGNALGNDFAGDFASAVFKITDASLMLDCNMTAEALLEKSFGKFIPIFETDNEEFANALVTLLKQKSYPDAFLLSRSSKILNAARDKYPLMYGMLDLRSTDGKSASEIATLANESQCRALLLSQSNAKRELVSAIQKKLITVFVEASDASDASHVAAICSGANGILTSDTASLVACYTSYFKKNSVVRSSNIIAHRGLPVKYQENSIAGSVAAYELGADVIETDIRLTKDGVVIAMHDATIDRTTTGSGSVASMTYAEISQYMLDDGKGLVQQKIPTLEDYFKEFKGKDVNIFVEIKSTEVQLATKVKELVDKYQIEDQISFISFKADQIARFKKAMPGVSCGYLNSSLSVVDIDSAYYAGEILELVQAADATFNPTYKNGIADKIIAQLNHRGVSVWPYTLNAKDVFDRFFMYGTSGITTNYTDWVTNMPRYLTSPSSVEINIGESAEVEVTKYLYSRKSLAAKGATVIELGNTGNVKYENGKLSASAPGVYNVIFALEATSAGGTKYIVYSEVTTLTVIDPNATEAPDQTTESPDSTESTTLGTTDTEAAKSKGCSGFATIASLIAVALCAVSVPVIVKKKL